MLTTNVQVRKLQKNKLCLLGDTFNALINPIVYMFFRSPAGSSGTNFLTK
jgi:hypothetical protein